MPFVGHRIYLLLAVALPMAARPVCAQVEARLSPTPIIDELREKQLLFPVAGSQLPPLKNTFREPRGHARLHLALDIPAPRGTAVLSTDSGRLLKLYRSEAGGLMVYAADPGGRFIYYYAHLDRYHDGISEGMTLARGDTIGYVGTTGNAPPSTPHLHFAILRSNNVGRWSKGMPVNPFMIFAHDSLRGAGPSRQVSGTK